MTVKSTIHVLILGMTVCAALHGVIGVILWFVVVGSVGAAWVILARLGSLLRSSMVRSVTGRVRAVPAEASVTTILALSIRDELVSAVRPLSSAELADRLDVAEPRIRRVLRAMTDRGIVAGMDDHYWLHRNRLGVLSLLSLLATRLQSA